MVFSLSPQGLCISQAEEERAVPGDPLSCVGESGEKTGAWLERASFSHWHRGMHTFACAPLQHMYSEAPIFSRHCHFFKTLKSVCRFSDFVKILFVRTCMNQNTEPHLEPKDVPVLIQLRLLDQRDASAKVRFTASYISLHLFNYTVCLSVLKNVLEGVLVGIHVIHSLDHLKILQLRYSQCIG